MKKSRSKRSWGRSENRWRRWSKTGRRRRESEMRARESLENDEREWERERESLACLMLINKPEEDDGITGQFNHLCRTHPAAAATSSNATSSPRAPRQIFEAWHFTLYTQARRRRRPRAYTSTATPLDPLNVQPIHAQPAPIPPPKRSHWLHAQSRGRGLIPAALPIALPRFRALSLSLSLFPFYHLKLAFCFFSLLTLESRKFTTSSKQLWIPAFIFSFSHYYIPTDGH